MGFWKASYKEAGCCHLFTVMARAFDGREKLLASLVVGDSSLIAELDELRLKERDRGRLLPTSIAGIGKTVMAQTRVVCLLELAIFIVVCPCQYLLTSLKNHTFFYLFIIAS